MASVVSRAGSLSCEAPLALSARKCALTEFCSLRGNLAGEVWKQGEGAQERREAKGQEPKRKGEPGGVELECRKERPNRLEEAEATSAWDLLADLEFSLKSNKSGLGARDQLSPFQKRPWGSLLSVTLGFCNVTLLPIQPPNSRIWRKATHTGRFSRAFV